MLRWINRAGDIRAFGDGSACAKPLYGPGVEATRNRRRVAAAFGRDVQADNPRGAQVFREVRGLEEQFRVGVYRVE